jgi:hypothetical protein
MEIRRKVWGRPEMDVLVHASLRGLRFILKALWHFELQNWKERPSLRQKVKPGNLVSKMFWVFVV